MLSLAISSQQLVAHEGSTTIELPHGTHVIGMSSLVASGGVPARPLVVIARTPEPLWCGFGRH